MRYRSVRKTFVHRVAFVFMILAFFVVPSIVSFSDAQAEVSKERGKQVFRDLGCMGCHMINGMGGRIGPELSRVGSRLKGERILAQLNNPKQFNPASMMPSYQSLPGDQKKSLVEYLKSLK